MQVNFGEAYDRSVVMSQLDLQTVSVANTAYNPVPSHGARGLAPGQDESGKGRWMQT